MSKKNPVAKDLRQPKYRVRVVEDKRRKKEKEHDKRRMEEGSGEGL